MTKFGWLKWALIVIAVLFASSWIAGQFRGCSGPPKPPPVVPGHVDPGAPVAGPVAEAPTVPTPLVVAVPDLKPEEVAAFMKKYGLVEAKDAPKPGRRGAQGQPPSPRATPPASPATQPPTEPPTAPVVTYPIPLAEERFSFVGVPGIAIDVSAAQLEPGGRVILNGVWLPYQPPTPEGPKRGWLGNAAEWEKWLMLGYIGQVIHHPGGETETKADPGIGFGLAFHSWRLNRATLDARGMGMLTTKLDGAGIVGIGVSWE